MGLSIVVSGIIISIALLIVLFTLFGSTDFLFLLEEGSSEIRNVEESISKTDMKIKMLNASSGSNLVNFTLRNLGNEKLWNYDEFDLFITYDADISGIKTRITEQLVFDKDSSFLPSSGGGTCSTNASFGTNDWIIGSISNDILDPKIVNTGEVGQICTKLSHPIFSNGVVAIVISSDNGVVTSKSQLVT